MRDTSAQRQSKAVTIAYASLAGIILLVIAAIALVIVPPSPPSVSEFAPQAVEQIDQAPDQQSSRFGSGAGGACVEGQICEGLDAVRMAPSRRVIEKTRVRRCVGDPPRQIEDPQSPPCVNYWQGDNGGATAQGVTRDEIRVAVPDPQTYEVLVSFFNSRFEFYGRKMRLVKYSYKGLYTPQEARASAVAANESVSFATFLGNGRTGPFLDEAARLKLITISHNTEDSEQQAARYHPFVWSYLLNGDQWSRHLEEFVCKSLVERPAQFAGSAYSLTPRSFAVLQLVDSVGSGRTDASPLVAGLQGCGAEVSSHEYSGSSQPSLNNRLLMADFQRRGITTVIVFGYDGFTVRSDFMPSASSSGYQPEWLLAKPGFVGESDWSLAPADQTQHLFGLLVDSKGLYLADKPPTWAYHEMGQQTGEEKSGSNSADSEEGAYKNLLILSSGIQAAGPDLDPDTFARGLQRLVFPNPGAASSPYYQATVGFGADHSMNDDVGLIWWSPGAPATSKRASDVGGWCYVQRGARWKLGHWPTRDHPLFDLTQPCR